MIDLFAGAPRDWSSGVAFLSSSESLFPVQVTGYASLPGSRNLSLPATFW
ncbi:hypothetical protein ASZ90_015673 [hydrocarbon metagenome]|uniref:Uncharacterized protein n=1 Tax=hydrocarbon metagenome TaxID=938273 RepID=A0A0W8F186_9ZZZZ